MKRQETVIAADFPAGTYLVPYQTETRTVKLAEGGVYRLFVVGEGWYEVIFSDNVVQATGNITNHAQHLFVARASRGASTPQQGKVFATLAIAFDERPQDVNWVLLASKSVPDPDTKRTRKERRVLAFGPSQEYASEFAGQLYTEKTTFRRSPRTKYSNSSSRIMAEMDCVAKMARGHTDCTTARPLAATSICCFQVPLKGGAKFILSRSPNDDLPGRTCCHNNF